MNTIDYIYRFDPKNPSLKPPPPDAEAARRTLEDGNRMFARWMESCRTSTVSKDEPRYVVQCNGLEVGMNRTLGQMPKQAPFAVVVGCSDARVPIEMLFGQGFNDLFVIRVAGNVLGDVCMGSIEFALNALSESVKCVVMIGHLGCGAVTGAVDSTYGRSSSGRSRCLPCSARSSSGFLWRSARRTTGSRNPGGPTRDVPGYREALIDIAVCVNAAQAAFDVRQEVRRRPSGRSTLRRVQPAQPPGEHAGQSPRPVSPDNVNLAYAPTNPKEFNTIAVRMAEMLKPDNLAQKPDDGSANGGVKAVTTDDSLILRRDDHLGREGTP